MVLNNVLLFLFCSLVWGSTWFAITLQLGVVDSMWSVCYRFTLATALLGGFCLFRGISLPFSFRQHQRLFFQGICLCGLSYWLVYESEKHISSGLSAIVCTTILYFNVVIGHFWLGNPVRRSVISGGILGSIGIAMIFFPGIDLEDSPRETALGLLLSLVAAVLFSLGAVTCEKNAREQMAMLPCVTMNMFYGALFLGVLAAGRGVTPEFEFSVGYGLSLLYLSLFGSIAAMTSYVQLINRIGADRTAYVDMVYPVIALGFSTIFEGYQWTLFGVAGVVVILIGNLLAMGKLGYSD
ncbi:MAG: DMT family transporter [Endozoicomonas sp.]